MGIERRGLNYGVGAVATLVISIGVAIVVYAMKVLTFDLWNLPAWIFGPLGVFTLVYSIVAGKEATYYLVWGVIVTSIGVISAVYNIVNIVVIVGIVIIVIAVIGLVAYLKGGRK